MTTLTRLITSPEHVGSAIDGFLREFKWVHVSWMIHQKDQKLGRGISDCHFTMAAIQRSVRNIVTGQEEFDEEKSTREDYRNILQKLKQTSRSELINVYIHEQIGVKTFTRKLTPNYLFTFDKVDRKFF